MSRNKQRRERATHLQATDQRLAMTNRYSCLAWQSPVADRTGGREGAEAVRVLADRSEAEPVSTRRGCLEGCAVKWLDKWRLTL